MRTKSLSEPVVFVHGYLDFWHAPWWSKIEKYMGKIGFDTTKLRRVNLGDVPGTTVGSPRRYAEKVREEVERAYDDHGEVSIIAHSMGGIDSRWYVEEMDGDELVDSLTTLGTPHLGTYAAYLGYFSEGGRELKPDSDVIRRLNRDGVEPNVSYNGIWGTKDLLVLPRKNGKVPDETLENVSNFEVNCGHLKMIFSESAFGDLLRLLEWE